jgi:hypothetical protein
MRAADERRRRLCMGLSLPRLVCVPKYLVPITIIGIGELISHSTCIFSRAGRRGIGVLALF